jgi:hypothetical protein
MSLRLLTRKPDPMAGLVLYAQRDAPLAAGSRVSTSLAVGAGVLAERTAAGNALKVSGKASFSRSGTVTVPAGKSSVTKSGVALTAASLVLATLQQHAAGGVRAGRGAERCGELVHGIPEQGGAGQHQGGLVRHQLGPRSTGPTSPQAAAPGGEQAPPVPSGAQAAAGPLTGAR